jgi:hypothetical protein
MWKLFLSRCNAFFTKLNSVGYTSTPTWKPWRDF